MAITRAGDILYRLGVGRMYKGHDITVKAVEMILRDEDCLLCVKRRILIPLGVEKGCDWRCIERNIRTVIYRAWKRNADYLSEMATNPLRQEPTVTEFLNILAVYLMRRGA